MERTRPTRRVLLLAALTSGIALSGGCVATQTQQATASDAAWNAPTFTVASADGFIVGDALGMTMLAGSDIRLADVSEPFELND